MTHATNFYKSLFGSSHPSHLRPLAATSRAAEQQQAPAAEARQSSKVAIWRIMCLSRHSGWRYKATLSHHWEWCDQREVPRHQVKNAVLTGLGHTMARQSSVVAPTLLARQMPCRPRWLGRGTSCRATCTGTTSLSRHAGWRDKANIQGPRRPLLPHPPFLSLTPPRPEQQ